MFASIRLLSCWLSAKFNNLILSAVSLEVIGLTIIISSLNSLPSFRVLFFSCRMHLIVFFIILNVYRFEIGSKLILFLPRLFPEKEYLISQLIVHVDMNFGNLC